MPVAGKRAAIVSKTDWQRQSFSPVYVRRLMGELGWTEKEALAFAYLVQNQGTPELGRRLRSKEIEEGYVQRRVTSAEIRRRHGWTAGQLARAMARLTSLILCPNCGDAHAMLAQLDRGEGRPHEYNFVPCADAGERISAEAFRAREEASPGKGPAKAPVDGELAARLIEHFAVECGVDLPPEALAAIAERSAHLFESVAAEVQARLVAVSAHASIAHVEADPEFVGELLGDGRKRFARSALGADNGDFDEGNPHENVRVAGRTSVPEFRPDEDLGGEDPDENARVIFSPTASDGATSGPVAAVGPYVPLARIREGAVDSDMERFTVDRALGLASRAGRPASRERITELYRSEWLPEAVARLGGDVERAQACISTAIASKKVQDHPNPIAALRNGLTRRGSWWLLTAPDDPAASDGACAVVFSRMAPGIQEAVQRIVEEHGADRQRLRPMNCASRDMRAYLERRFGRNSGGSPPAPA